MLKKKIKVNSKRCETPAQNPKVWQESAWAPLPQVSCRSNLDLLRFLFGRGVYVLAYGDLYSFQN